jgi:chromosome segregation ATPase
MEDRSVLDDLGHQAALVKVETKEITRYCECFSQERNERIHEKNEALHKKLEQLKNMFKILRAVREVNNIVVTLDENLRDMRAKMRAFCSEIDAARMRKNAGIAKIEKQLHQLDELSMRTPDPPDPSVAVRRANYSASQNW